MFGFSVGISGDTIVVGAIGEASAANGVNGNQFDGSAPLAGAAYVFERSAGLWSQSAYLKASNTDSDDMFGYAVAISGDTVVVGAPYEDSAATGLNGNQMDNSVLDAGAAYVFERHAGSWAQAAYLKASNTGAADGFGYSAAIDGDTIAIGAPFEAGSATGSNGNQIDESSPGSGAAYLFVRTSGAWAQQAYLKASIRGLTIISVCQLQSRRTCSLSGLLASPARRPALTVDSPIIQLQGQEPPICSRVMRECGLNPHI
jgi:hypothetical protein